MGMVIVSLLDVVKMKQLGFHSKEMTGTNCAEKRFGGFLFKTFSIDRWQSSSVLLFGSPSVVELVVEFIDYNIDLT